MSSIGFDVRRKQNCPKTKWNLEHHRSGEGVANRSILRINWVRLIGIQDVILGTKGSQAHYLILMLTPMGRSSFTIHRHMTIGFLQQKKLLI